MGLFVLKENKEVLNNINDITLTLQESIDQMDNAMNDYLSFCETIDDYYGTFRRDNNGNEYINKYNRFKGKQHWWGRIDTVSTLPNSTEEFSDKGSEQLSKEYTMLRDQMRERDFGKNGNFLSNLINKFRRLYTKVLYKLKKSVRAKEAGFLKRLAHSILNFIDKMAEKLENLTAGNKKVGKEQDDDRIAKATARAKELQDVFDKTEKVLSNMKRDERNFIYKSRQQQREMNNYRRNTIILNKNNTYSTSV